jgi:F-type H+-transporting ATPase subunit a
MQYYTPLEQFEVGVIQPIVFDRYGLWIDISITTLTIACIFLLVVTSLFLYSGIVRMKVIPTPWQVIVESMYEFVFEMIRQQVGLKGQVFFPLFFTTFFYILVSNLLGLTPYAVTITSYIAVTFSIALSFNVGFLVLGVVKNKKGFLKLFIPSDAPAALVPLITVIEIVSYLIRTFSLSLRLFANMMAGHTLLHILGSFVLKFYQMQSYIIAIFPFILVLAVIGLEFGIAFLQAYVFVILLCIYLNDAYHPGH